MKAALKIGVLVGYAYIIWWGISLLLQPAPAVQVIGVWS